MKRLEWIYEEISLQKDSMFMWAPVFTAIGIGLYFALPAEPPFILGAVLLLTLISVRAVFKDKFSFHLPLLVLLLVTGGFVCAQMRIHMIHTPVLQKDKTAARVSGVVESVEQQDKGRRRMVLSDVRIEDVSPENTPRKVRLTFRDHEELKAGMRIEGLAGLHVPSPPLIPHGFDFQRYMYFQGIGAVGFFYRDIEVLEDAQTGFQRLHIFEKLRRKIAERVQEYLAQPESGLAMALMVGRKASIGDEENEAMRTAGLAHILAISGLHIGLFSGAVFFMVRLLLALIPNMALHYPIKKYAALAAICAACFYTGIAGASIPTLRAMIMTGAVFIAVMLDRSPISLRLVAFAALVILVVFSETLLSASFQLSFAAVTGLIVFYDWLRPHWSVWYSGAGVIRRAALYFLGISLTTIIATIATAPFSLFHFQTLATYGLLANFIAVPILAFIIMPAIILAFFLMPFGLDGVAFYIIGVGIHQVLDIAQWVSALPHSQIEVSLWRLSAFIVIVLGAVWFCLWRGNLRLIGVFIVVSGMALAMLYPLPKPVALVGKGADLIAIRDEDKLYVSSLRRETFSREQWMQALKIDEDHVFTFPKEGQAENTEAKISCDGNACRFDLKGAKISYVRDAASLAEECLWADALIADVPVSYKCRSPHVIDLFDTLGQGVHAVYAEGQDESDDRESGERALSSPIIRIENTLDLRGQRPWSVAP